ncbi:TPR_REGION domain-containing protein [Psidium guajava]|nr:TPR_REGION domain-containing protein [Psidium guajava]
MTSRNWMKNRRFSVRGRLKKMMKCIFSGEQVRVDETIDSSESLATRDYSASGYSSRAGEAEPKVDKSNIEEAESSLRESGYLNYEEARALLGRLEYQKGNIEAALHVFEGIDIAAVAPKMRVSISRRADYNRRHSQSDAAPTMSMHAVTLLFEAIFLKAKALEHLGRFDEAAQSCKIILDTVESALPHGLPESFKMDFKIQETLNKVVELVPELLKFAGDFQEAILSYRRALLYHWNLEVETAARIQKEFAIFLLYCGVEVEELPPGILERNERYCILSLCYHGEGEDMVALNLLRNVFRNREHPDCILEMMLASKICGKNEVCIEEGIGYACKALRESHGRCSQRASISNCLLGTLLSAKSRLVSSDSERTLEQSKALAALEASERMMKERDPFVVHQLCLENAEQRKLDIALYYAKQLLKLEAGASVNGYVLLARILSAQKRFVDAETVINAALDQTGKWDKKELLRTKAKLQVAQDQLNNAIETYSQLLAVLQVQTKSAGIGDKYSKNRGQHKSLELDTWNDLANVYTSLSRWRDAEVCLSKSEAISPFSASRWHSTGLLYQAKGLHQDALKSFGEALNVEPNHVPSLISTACVLRQLGTGSLPVIRSLLTDALRLDRTNPSAWFNLGLVYKSDPAVSALEVAECFEAAALLQETAPVEPFR